MTKHYMQLVVNEKPCTLTLDVDDESVTMELRPATPGVRVTDEDARAVINALTRPTGQR